MPTIRIALPRPGGHAYDVVVRPGAFGGAAAVVLRLARKRRIAIVSDSKVARLYGEKLLRGVSRRDARTRLFAFPAGERSKTRATKARLEDALLKASYGRDSLLVALGGGVVGDLTGFLAATLHRGVPFVQIPTTLLAMVDSAVGGKTGVDTPAGKNLVGAFWQPVHVISDPDLLGTLAPREIRAGMAEVAKHGVIAGAGLFAYVEKNLDALLAGAPGPTAHVVAESCRIKAAVVARDEREGGYRQILNFGHTIAHAVELERGYGLLHGEAVWAGMSVEARAAASLGLLPEKDAQRICSLVERACPPRKVLKGIRAESVLKAASLDKKARGGRARYALPKRIGRMEGAEGAWSVEVPPQIVRSAMRQAASGAPRPRRR